MKHHGFRAEDIVLLTDDAKDARSKPTRRNIVGGMRWLVKGARTDDSLFFHCASFSFFLSLSLARIRFRVR
jgi:hypothetical protein